MKYGRGIAKINNTIGINATLSREYPPTPQRDADQNQDEADLRNDEDRAQFADDVHDDREQNQGQPAPGWSTDARQQYIAPRPKEPRRHDRYQKSVTVFFLPSPALHQLEQRSAEIRRPPRLLPLIQAGSRTARSLAQLEVTRLTFYAANALIRRAGTQPHSAERFSSSVVKHQRILDAPPTRSIVSST